MNHNLEHLYELILNTTCYLVVLHEGTTDQQSQGDFASQFLRSHHVDMKVIVFGLNCGYIFRSMNKMCNGSPSRNIFSGVVD